MMAVAVAEEGDALRLGQPEVLFRVDRPQFSPPFASWDCLPDGRFVLILDPTEEEQAASIRAMYPDRLRIVQGWTGKVLTVPDFRKLGSSGNPVPNLKLK